jgi:hypothetical protein
LGVSPDRTIKLTAKDLKLIQELGLDNLSTFESVDEKISLLNMRQLYRLKLMFLRISSEEALFSETARAGIQRNDLRSYSDAFLSVWKAQGPAGETTKDKA